MPRPGNITRASAIYHHRQQVRLPNGKGLRMKLSLHTACPRQARLMAVALTLYSDRPTAWMDVKAEVPTTEQRVGIYRAQMARERDWMEAMHASLTMRDPAEPGPLGQSLARLAGVDAISTGREGDFLVTQVDPDVRRQSSS